jgi:hypothetical protein
MGGGKSKPKQEELKKKPEPTAVSKNQFLK